MGDGDTVPQDKAVSSNTDMRNEWNYSSFPIRFFDVNRNSVTFTLYYLQLLQLFSAPTSVEAASFNRLIVTHNLQSR